MGNMQWDAFESAVILSDDLTWNMHVDSIVQKLLNGYICCIS